MFKQVDRSSQDKNKWWLRWKNLRQVPHSFCLNIWKRFFVEVSFKNQIIEYEVL